MFVGGFQRYRTFLCNFCAAILSINATELHKTRKKAFLSDIKIAKLLVKVRVRVLLHASNMVLLGLARINLHKILLPGAFLFSAIGKKPARILQGIYYRISEC